MRRDVAATPARTTRAPLNRKRDPIANQRRARYRGTATGTSLSRTVVTALGGDLRSVDRLIGPCGPVVDALGVFTFERAAEVNDVPIRVIVDAVRSGRLPVYLIDGRPMVRDRHVWAATSVDLRRL